MIHPRTKKEAILQTLRNITEHIADLKENGNVAGFPFGTIPTCALCQLAGKAIATDPCGKCLFPVLFPYQKLLKSFAMACMLFQPKGFVKSLSDMRRAYNGHVREVSEEINWFQAAHDEIEAAAIKEGWIPAQKTQKES